MCLVLFLLSAVLSYRKTDSRLHCLVGRQLECCTPREGESAGANRSLSSAVVGLYS